MCQLLGMNCNTPTDIVFSFEGFRRRAGLTDCHSDGFGIAFFEGRGVRIFRDNHAASQSPIADCVKQYPRNRPLCHPHSTTPDQYRR